VRVEEFDPNAIADVQPFRAAHSGNLEGLEGEKEASTLKSEREKIADTIYPILYRGYPFGIGEPLQSLEGSSATEPFGRERRRET